MMKVGLRFFLSLTSAIFLVCLASSALGQSADNGKTGIGTAGLNHTLTALLVAPEPALRRPVPRDRDDNNNNNNNKNGCSAQANGRDKRNNCATVPEGGTAFAYLSLVALGCLATGIFGMRRRLHDAK